MSKKDKTKTILNALLAFMIVVLTALFGVVGYIFIHRRELDFVDSLAVVFAILFLIVIFCGLGLRFRKELKRLEKMK